MIDVFNNYKNYTEIQNPFILDRSFTINNNSRTFKVAFVHQFNTVQSKYKGQNLSSEWANVLK